MAIILHRDLLIRLYNDGYHAGHNDTVENNFTNILPVDMDTYHADIVNELLREYTEDVE